MRLKIENAELLERLGRGEYEIDARAVAEAILRRRANPFGGLPSLEMLEAPELDLPAVSTEEGEALAEPHATDPADTGPRCFGGLCH